MPHLYANLKNTTQHAKHTSEEWTGEKRVTAKYIREGIEVSINAYLPYSIEFPNRYLVTAGWFHEDWGYIEIATAISDKNIEDALLKVLHGAVDEYASTKLTTSWLQAKSLVEWLLDDSWML